MNFLEIIGAFVILYYLFYIIFPWFCDCDALTKFTEKFGKPVDSLKGKVIWIVGASSGIGEHLAYTLADVGCKLILSARRTDLLENVKNNCLKENIELSEEDILILPFDLLNVEENQKMLGKVLSKFGKLDILVNNAGRTQRAVWENIDLEVDKEVFELNLFSIISLSRVVLKYFLRKGEGHFAVTSSVGGIANHPYSSSYSGSKHALHGYFEALRVEKISKNIAITMICPGPVQTDFLYESFTDKIGVKLEQKAVISSNKVTAKRCGQLISVALANKLEETWIANPPFITHCYLTYYPNLYKIIMRLLYPGYFLRLRDSKLPIKL